MFTGLVEEIGTIKVIEPQNDAMRLGIQAQTVLGDAKLGDSIAVNGVCLTVTDLEPDAFHVDVMQETINRTSLSRLKEGSPVNLERALLPTTRLGGHIVQGHVDDVAEVVSRDVSEHWEVVRFSLPADIAAYVVEKGSIALNGTSLTVASVGDDWFEVSFIPTTLRDTTHGQLSPGDIVNVEVDILAKYVEKMTLTAGVDNGADNNVDAK